ncbi:MAG: hypothetical protein PQJ58_20315 [Spirochaetales bacterium]|nr:hypothetical protein [Spirochaetales bacterium]
MKNVIKALALLALVMICFSCDLFAKADEELIKTRISAFQSTLNAGGYTNTTLNAHFHEDMVSYNAYLDSEIFTIGPLNPLNGPFTFGTPSLSASGDDYDISGTYAAEGAGVDDGNYTAIMRQEGSDWKILEMTIDVGSSVDYTIRTLK